MLKLQAQEWDIIIIITHLGTPVLKGKAQDKAIQDKIDDLTRAVECLNTYRPFPWCSGGPQEQNGNTQAAVSAQDLSVATICC